MNHPLNTKPLLCRELVGRKDELRTLEEAWKQAAQGQPQLVMLAGEAGVGKTRLCRACMQIAQRQQAQVLFGQAILQDQALPFAPFLDAFRRCFTASPELFAHSASWLLPLLPELAAEVPLSLIDAESTPVRHQQMMFHYILRGLQAITQAHEGPVLFILEDLHWADETSLELLAFLAQRLKVNAVQAEVPLPLMLLGTYRSEALPDNEALRRLLWQLHARRQVYELTVTPLDPQEHRQCIRDIFGQPVSEEFNKFLFDWDEGNPFFTEELLGAMAASGQLHKQAQGWLIPADVKPSMPLSLTAAILERFGRLPADDQEVLAYAAVIGRVFDFPLLAALCGIDEHTLIGVLRRAKSLQLISEVGEVGSAPSSNGTNRGPERYQFRHALTREAIYEQMLAPERRLRHRKVAEMLETLTADSSMSLTGRERVSYLLAEHYWLAGLAERARPYALQEAERASRVFAFREERYYLNMAQASLPENSPQRLQLLYRLGMLELGTSNFAEAIHWFTLARHGYEQIGQPLQALQALSGMLLPSWFLASNSMTELVDEVEAKAEAIFAQGIEGGANFLAATSLVATYRAFDCQFQRAALWIERGLTLFEALDDPHKVPAIQLSLMAQGWLKAHQDTVAVEEGISQLRQVIHKAREYSLPDVILLSNTWLMMVLIAWGRNDEAEKVSEHATEYQKRSGMVGPTYLEGWLRFFAGERWDEEIERLRQHSQRMALGNVPALAAIEVVPLAHMLIARNELAEAQAHLQNARTPLERMSQYTHVVPLWWGFAKLAVVQGDHRQAQEWYESIFNRWQACEDRLIIAPVLPDGITFYAEMGNLTRARQWLAELANVTHAMGNPVYQAALWEAEGVLASKEGRLAEALQLLRQAVQAWGSLKRRYAQALAAQRLATLLLTWAKGRDIGRANRQAARQEAETLLEQAEAVYKDLHIPTGLQAIVNLRSSTGLEAQGKRRSTLASRQHEEGLTEREMQILIQLVAGRTNKEIAALLHISVGTVELHVTHILNKLGCESRTQAATYAIARGWVRHPSG